MEQSPPLMEQLIVVDRINAALDVAIYSGQRATEQMRAITAELNRFVRLTRQRRGKVSPSTARFERRHGLRFEGVESRGAVSLRGRFE